MITERHAYMNGDTQTADLLDRIDLLQQAVGDSLARITQLELALVALLDDQDEAARSEARRVLRS